MGTALSTFKESVTDEAEKQKADDVLNAVVEMANLELELFYEKITNSTFDAKMIKIDRVLTKDLFIFASTTDKPASIVDTVKQVGKNFTSDQTAEGVGRIIDRAFSMLLGDVTATKQKHETYAITAGELGNVNRLDIIAFQYNFASKALMNNVTGVRACLVVKSIADTKDLTDNALRGIVDQTFCDSTLDRKRKIYEELKAASTPPDAYQDFPLRDPREEARQAQLLALGAQFDIDGRDIGLRKAMRAGR